MMTAAGKSLEIICATSLAGGKEAFSTLGNVRMIPEKAMDAALLRHADILVTRSKVKVDDRLLEGSHLSFYGTATAGFDHVDVEALTRRSIGWSQALGSNANSVAEYVIASLAWLGRKRQTSWTGKTIGIIGAGHVGSRLAARAEALGLHVMLNDPPLLDRTGDSRYLPLHHLLEQCDIISLHVPLIDDGLYPTRGMVHTPFFSRMKKGAVFINASRGEVVIEKSLRQAVGDQIISGVILDVFENEPDPDPRTLAIADIATPHIAGYSMDARLRGTEMIYQAACRHFGKTPIWHVPPVSQPVTLPPASSLFDTILAAYNPYEDDCRLRTFTAGTSMSTHFQELRRTYPERREFKHFAVEDTCCPPHVQPNLATLGFVIRSSR